MRAVSIVNFSMARQAIPTWSFVLVVVRLGHRYLVVHERKHGQHWYLPAGRVEPGETFPAAARRETLEEAGLPIKLEGILRVEHSPHPEMTRMRVVYLARPVDDTPPKSLPDQETLGAKWCTLKEVRELSLRGPEVVDILSAVERGVPIYPLSLIQFEGAPL